jgi:hypothetical protein
MHSALDRFPEADAPVQHETLSAGRIHQLRAKTLLPMFASLGMIVASAGAEEKRSPPQDPKARVEWKTKEMKAYPPHKLVQALDDNDCWTRVAAADLLRERALSEVRRTRKPLAWKNALLPNGLSAEQRRSLGSILGDIEELERSFWWEGTQMKLDAKTQLRMKSLGGTLDVLREQGNCIVVLDKTLPASVLSEPVTGIPEAGTFWEVLRSLRVQGKKQLVPFLADGALSLKIADESLPTACDGALYGYLETLENSKAELRVFAEPKLFTHRRSLQDVHVPGGKKLKLFEESPYYGRYSVESPTGLGPGTVSVSILASGSLMHKIHLEGPDGKILTAGDHAFAWSGVPQVPNPDGCYYAEMKMLKGADPRVLWGLQCNVFDDQGKSMDMEGPSCWKFFPGLRTWKLLEHRRPASADVYLPGSDIGSALRTLRFQNVPQILPGPES